MKRIEIKITSNIYLTIWNYLKKIYYTTFYFGLFISYFLPWYQFQFLYIFIVVDLKVSLNCNLNQIRKRNWRTWKNVSCELIIDLFYSDLINNNRCEVLCNKQLTKCCNRYLEIEFFLTIHDSQKRLAGFFISRWKQPMYR